MSVEIINFGARIKSIKFPVNGVPTEMILGYAAPQEYIDDEFYLGLGDFTGDIIFPNLMGTADSTALGMYSLTGGGVGQYNSNISVQDGEIVTGVDFYFSGQPIF